MPLPGRFPSVTRSIRANKAVFKQRLVCRSRMPMIPNAYRIFNFDLGETADAIRQTVHDFAGNEIAPRAAEIDRSNQFPRDLWPKIGALGLHGITAGGGEGGEGRAYLSDL